MRLARAIACSTLLAVLTGLAGPAPAQTTRPAAPTEVHNIIVPQARRTVHARHTQAVQLSAVEVTVGIEEQVATTSMQLTLSNPAPRPQQAELVLPVPDGVTIRSVQYDGTGPEPTARLLPREEARREYDAIVRKALDPALVEFVGYNLIRTSAFPIPAGASQKLTVTFEQVLAADGDRIDYVLPRSESLAEANVNWSIKASIACSRGIASTYSPSHDLTVEKQGDSKATARSTATRPMSPGAFRLSCLRRPAGSGELSATLFAYPDPAVNNGQGGYFMLLATLPKPSASEKPAKREVVLVMDRSGSMRGEKIEQARKAALQVLAGLEIGEWFNVIDYSDSVASFAPAPVEKTSASAAQARSYIEALQANGGTNIHDALLEALRPVPPAGAVPMILFLTDGLPTVGERSEVGIRDAVKLGNRHNRRIFSFGVGYDVNAPLLSTIAKTSRAAITLVMPEEDVEVKVSQVFARLRGPVLMEPRLLALDADSTVSTRVVREVLPAVLPDVFENDEIVVLGQYTSDQALRFRLQGHHYSTDRAFELTFQTGNASARNGFVPRIWATRRIAALTEEIRMAAADGSASNDARTKELTDEIVRLSTRWGVMTEYTSFLATDETAPLAGFENGFTKDGLEFIRPSEAPAPAATRALAGKQVYERTRERSGTSGAAQTANESSRQYRLNIDASGGGGNVMLGADMKKVAVGGIQQINDRALFRRSGRWVDSALGGQEDKDPDITVEFGTDEYMKIVDQLAQQGRQGLLAMGGDAYLFMGGKRVLVKAPPAE